MHFLSEAFEVADTAVMRKKQLLRLAGHDAVDGLVRLDGVELYRSRRRKNDLPVGRVQFAI